MYWGCKDSCSANVWGCAAPWGDTYTQLLCLINLLSEYTHWNLWSCHIFSSTRWWTSLPDFFMNWGKVPSWTTGNWSRPKFCQTLPASSILPWNFWTSLIVSKDYIFQILCEVAITKKNWTESYQMTISEFDASKEFSCKGNAIVLCLIRLLMTQGHYNSRVILLQHSVFHDLSRRLHDSHSPHLQVSYSLSHTK